MTSNPKIRLSAVLMATVSGLSLAIPAQAAHILFSSKGDTLPSVGERVHQVDGLKQIRLDGGATISVLDAADYRINADGSVDLYAGSVTVASGAGETVVRMPAGVEGRVAGRGSAANFSVAADGAGRGHALSGQVSVGPADDLRRFKAGEMFAFAPGRRPEQTVANGAQATPGADAPPVVSMADGGPVAAAQNGVPVTLGDALAAAGASSDILAAARRIDAAVANPAIETFPSGDLALLVARAGDLAHAYGGESFPAAQADIVRAYLSWLAGGGSRADFLTAYAGFLGDYLDLLRSGAAPSSFGAADLANIEAFLAYGDRTGRLAQLGARDRALAEAYLAFLRGGGDRDLFTARFVDLTRAYLAFVRAGGNPDDFTQASADTIARYIAFLSDSGLAQQLGASDRALLDAYLANGGLAFAGQYRAALDGYFAWLAAGRLPSGYAELDAATLRTYLETLSSAGLLSAVAGERAAFFSAYLDWLRGGGAPDAFAGLPANVFAGYAGQLDTYFAWLAAGKLPSAYQGADVAQLQAFLAQLQAAGALERFLGERADFFAAYLAFLQGGGQADAFAGLNANIFAGYAQALAAYFDYLENGGIPSGYTALTPAQIRAYLAALDAAGASGLFLGDRADFYAGYLAFIAGGGNPDQYAGLPVPPDYPAFAAALNAYAAFLAGGGLPADYDAQSLATLKTYLDAVVASGRLADLLGNNAALLNAYFAHLAGGGAPNGFSGLPVYANYVVALNAYYAYLANGGLPAGYGALTPAQIRAYLAALNGAGGLSAFADLDGFFAPYYAYLASGGDPAQYADLPVHDVYVAALNAYYAYLANGGLPAGYTTLTQEQIAAYLAALNAAGGFAAHGDLDAFFGAYYAFLAGGGDAADYGGLPVYANWLQAVQAYYAFLLGGGVPSEYTALTPEQVETYLAALDRAGVLEERLPGAALQFLVAYLAHIETGADPDQFAGLPGTGTNPGYPGGFPSGVTGARAYAAHAGVSAHASGAPQLDANGALTDAGDLANVDAQVADVGGDASVVVGRYTNGTARFRGGNVNIGPNGGVPWVVTAPLAAPLPTAGTIDYEVLAATKPVFASGRAAPGSFDASLTIGFGPSNLSYGFDGTIVMPENGGDVRYDFASEGRSTGALVNTGGINPVFNMNGKMTGSGSACNSSNCLILFYGGFGGSQDRIGMTYQTVDNPNFQSAERIQGTVAFASAGTGGVDPDPDPQYNSVAPPPRLAYAGGFSPTGPVVNFITTLTLNNGQTVPGSESGSIATSYGLSGDGGLVQYTHGGVTRTNGSTTITDASGNADMLIGRWTDGVNTGANPFTLSADQGLHYMLTRPVASDFALPVQGLISYDLLAATRPTIIDGSLPAGGFDGDMAIVLGAAPKVAFDATITMPGLIGEANRTFRYATAGGMSDPTQSQTSLTSSSGGRFGFLVPGVAGPDCQTANCQFDANGAFAGNSEQLGLTYAARNDLGDAKTLIGAALFGNGTLSGGPAPEPTFVTANLLSAEARLSSTYDANTIHPINLSVTANPNANQGYEIDASGAIVGIRTIGSFGGYDRIGTATHADSGMTDSGVLQWTRWRGGTLDMGRNAGTGGRSPVTLSDNQGYHFIVGTPSVNLPASGRVDYQLVGGTRPTQRYGAGAPGALVSGAAAVQFGAQAKVGIDLVFDYNSDRFTARTAGGLADLSASELSLSNGAFYAIGANGNVTSTGGTCTTSCRAIWTGFLAGPSGKEMGLEYVVQLGSATNEVIGVAGFAAQPAPTVSTGDYTNQYLLNVTYARTNDAHYNSKVTYDANGAITQWTRSNGSPVGVLPQHRGPAEESGSVNGVIGWARWLDTNNFNTSDPKLPNSGNPIVTGTQASALPTSGGVEYQLIGKTRPVDRDANLEPGTFTGNLAIDFATKKVGFDFAVAIDQYGWEVRTAGGAANPANGGHNLLGSRQVEFDGAALISGTTAASCTTSCSSNVRGALFGPGASHVGVGYSINDGSLAVSGVATFAAPPPAVP
ncbi:MAG: hypothetical protein JNM03_17800 [Sphingopyxis sp.]|nr:hypothetical protein [Sphingopyxis sp.]